MVAYPGRIFESTEGIEIKLGTYIDVNEKKTRTIILSYILSEGPAIGLLVKYCVSNSSHSFQVI